MNTPPDSYVSVPVESVRTFVSDVGLQVGLPREKADLLAELLTDNDLRGNFSHGSRQIATYALLMRDGKLNASPSLELVKETPVSVLIDGDGGLGYFPSHLATEKTLEKALASGIAVGMSRNHGHFGAAGIYARMTVEQDVLCFVTSGHQLRLKPDQPLYNAAGGSPMAFSVPCGERPHLVLDFGTMHDLYAGNPERDTLARMAPGLVLRSIGLGEICQAWGGLLSGLSLSAETPRWTYPGANQGAMFVIMRIDLFRDPSELKAEMDAYVDAVSELAPLPGFSETFMPGGVEQARMQSWLASGIPLGPGHRTALEEIGGELGVPVPWEA